MAITTQNEIEKISPPWRFEPWSPAAKKQKASVLPMSYANPFFGTFKDLCIPPTSGRSVILSKLRTESKKWASKDPNDRHIKLISLGCLLLKPKNLYMLSLRSLIF